MGSLKQNTSGNIGKSAIISYISIFLNIIISFFYTPWMMHKIGVSDYGLYHLVIAFVSYFIMDFGLNSSVTRFIAKYRAEDNYLKIRQILGLTLKVFIAIDLVILITLFICYFFIGSIFGGLTPEEIEKVKVLFVIAGVFSALTFVLKPLDGALNAFELFVPNKIIDLVQRVGVVLLVIACLLLGGNVYHLVLINCAGAFVCSLTKYIVFSKKTQLSIAWSYNSKNDLKEIFSFSGWIFLQSLAMRFRLTFIPTILGILSNSAQIAVFSLGATLESLIWSLSAALNGLFLPKVSKMSYDGNREVLQQLLIKVGRIQLIIIFLIYSGFVTIGAPFIELWAGNEFGDVYYIVLALTFSYIIGNTTQIASDLVMAENKVRYTTTITFITSAFGLIGSFVVAGRSGALGCAIFSGLALVVNQLFYFPVYQRKLGLDMKRFLKECHLKILPVLLLYATLFFIVTKLFAINNWIILIAAGAIYTILYLTIVYFFLLNNVEKELITSIIRKR